jgi:hypothetical protein
MLTSQADIPAKCPRDVSKPAFGATSHHTASSTDPSTWASYETAVANRGGLDVLGFVFAEGGGLTGVDFDHCIHEGVPEPWARATVEKLGSYAEVSVSGDGYHVILRGTLKGSRHVFNRDGERCKVEVYSAGRYFTVSENHVPATPTELCDRQAELDELEHELFGAKREASATVSAPSSSSFTSTYHPTWQVWAEAIRVKPVIGELRGGELGGCPSPSEAVGKLIFELAWFTKDRAQIEAMFQDSGLYGDGEGQWDERKWARLGAKEIGDALDAQTGKYYDWFSVDHPVKSSASANGVAPADPEKPFGITAREFASRVPEKVEWIWEPYIARGDLVEFDGKAKQSGKSTLIWHLVRAIETSADYLGGATTKGDVVVLSEMAGSSLREQLKDAGILGSEHLHLVLYNEWSNEPWESIAARAIAKCKQVGALLLVIDTLPKWSKIRGSEGNDEGHWLERMEHLEVLHGGSTAVVALCHDRKSGGAVGESGAGNTARTGAMDTVIRLSRIDGSEASRQRRLEAIGRHPDAPESRIISLTTAGYVVLGDKPDALRTWVGNEIREAMADGEPWTVRGLTTATDGKDTTVRRALDWLIDHGIVHKTPGSPREGATYRLVQVTTGAPPAVVT